VRFARRPSNSWLRPEALAGMFASTLIEAWGTRIGLDEKRLWRFRRAQGSGRTKS
jgi:hypothetical protein